MYNQPKPKNPWTKNAAQFKKAKNVNVHKSGPTPSELRFKEAQSKLQAAVKKHVEEYDSSSDEEEQLDSFNFIGEFFNTPK